MLKKGLLLIILLYRLFTLNAQETGNVKFGVETGFLPFSKDTENLGLFINVEPKVKILTNTYLGLSINLTINSHTFENSDPFQYVIDERFDNGIFSFTPTVEHYWHFNNFQPYLGLGLSYNLQPNPIEIFAINTPPTAENVIEGNVNERIGVLLRGGTEIGRLRLGMTYNFIPKADISLLSEQVVGTVGNSSISLSVGFMIFGNKKWATPTERSNPND